MIKKEAIQDALLEMGLMPHVKGFNYLVDAVMYIDENSQYYIGDIYQALADKYQTSVSRAERSIRYALMCIRNNISKHEVIERYLGMDRLSNSKSLVKFHLMLRREHEGGENL